MAEIDTCRHLAKYCSGITLDLGHGGSRPLVDNAICIDREPGNEKRAKEGDWPTHIVWDVFSELPFKDGVIDTISSFHVLEDSSETTKVLKEWLRILKPYGHLILGLPDQKLYEVECEKVGALPNQAHRVPMSLDWIKNSLIATGVPFSIVHEIDAPTLTNNYSFEVVIKKL